MVRGVRGLGLVVGGVVALACAPLGAGHFDIDGGAVAAVKVKLSSKAIVGLGGKQSVEVKVEVKDHDARGRHASETHRRKLQLPDAGPAGAAAPQAARWRPPQRLTWYWQLQGAVRSSWPAKAFDVDGFDNSAAEVAALHRRGKRVICYIDAGTWENWRPDAHEFPRSVLGKNNAWPGERWLDIRQRSVIEPIMRARFAMCARKHFDAVEADNIDGYENDTGFPITARQQLVYNEWIAAEVHRLGLAVFQKNDPEQTRTLQPYFDGALDEQCNQYQECSSFRPYLRAEKPVLNAEYQAALYPGFCATDGAAGIMGALYDLALDGRVYRPCWK